MVDNRSAGVFGIGGNLNFKSGDISGTAAKTSDDKMGQGTEYFAMEQQEEQNEFNKNHFVDRSAQLSATLNSLAMMNVADVIKSKNRSKALDKDKNKKKEEEEKAELEKMVKAIENSSDSEESENDLG